MFEIQNLCSGLFSDAMDRLGHKNQIISGLFRNNSSVRFLGRARTILIETIETYDENLQLGLGFLEKIGKGDILVVEGSDKFAYFGEMMTRISIRQGIEGVVIGGLTRDTIYTHNNCNLPIMAKGYTPVDIKGRGRVVAVDTPIQIDDVDIINGDFIFADNDAVCVVPRDIEEKILNAVQKDIREELRIIDLINSNTSITDIIKQVKSF